MTMTDFDGGSARRQLWTPAARSRYYRGWKCWQVTEMATVAVPSDRSYRDSGGVGD